MSKKKTNWYVITSDAAWELAQDRGYKVSRSENCRIRMVNCTKEQWLELDPMNVWLQKQYGENK